MGHSADADRDARIAEPVIVAIVASTYLVWALLKVLEALG